MLRKEYGISMHEAEHEMPAYEVDMLIRQYIRHNGGEGAGADEIRDPFAAVPDDLKLL